jgi:heterodisulfide reductase subunit A
VNAPISSSTTTSGAVMVVGGGVAGVQAALDLSVLGFKVYLIEKSGAIGGVMARLDKTFPTNDCSLFILAPKLVEAGRDANIEILTKSELLELSGEPGHFTAKIRKEPRYIDEEVCTGCGQCTLQIDDEVPGFPAITGLVHDNCAKTLQEIYCEQPSSRRTI